MNNAVLLQQVFEGVYPSGDFRPMVELTRARNEAYCKRYNFDLNILIGVPSEKVANAYLGQWAKVEMIINALAEGYEYVFWLDADALIKDLETDIRYAFVNGIGACWHRIPQLNHWNTGVLYVRNTPEVKVFMDEWMSQFPGDWQWHEQGIFNTMAMQSRIVQTISDRWNATLNYSMVPDAVVLGFHGAGNALQRLELMQGAITFPKKAEQDSRAKSEV